MLLPVTRLHFHMAATDGKWQDEMPLEWRWWCHQSLRLQRSQPVFGHSCPSWFFRPPAIITLESARIFLNDDFHKDNIFWLHPFSVIFLGWHVPGSVWRLLILTSAPFVAHIAVLTFSVGIVGCFIIQYSHVEFSLQLELEFCASKVLAAAFVTADCMISVLMWEWRMCSWWSTLNLTLLELSSKKIWIVFG